MAETSGTIDFPYQGEIFQTHYLAAGHLTSSAHRPLILLHGGPGFSHHYMLPHFELFASHGIPIVLYDQIGNGRSTHLPDKPPSFWTMDLFMDELNNLLTHLGVRDDFDLLGHSWGGMLAADYASSRLPEGLKHLAIISAPASMDLWSQSTNSLLEKFPKDFQDMLKKHEREGTTDSKEYQDGMNVFYAKHICQLDPWPEQLLASFAAMEKDATVYSTMHVIGVSEFNITGTLKTWSVLNSIHKIPYPTLLANGKDDEAQDICMMPFDDRIPDTKWERFSRSHVAMFEEKDKYLTIVAEFLGTSV